MPRISKKVYKLRIWLILCIQYRTKKLLLAAIDEFLSSRACLDQMWLGYKCANCRRSNRKIWLTAADVSHSGIGPKNSKLHQRLFDWVRHSKDINQRKQPLWLRAWREECAIQASEDTSAHLEHLGVSPYSILQSSKCASVHLVQIKMLPASSWYINSTIKESVDPPIFLLGIGNKTCKRPKNYWSKA